MLRHEASALKDGADSFFAEWQNTSIYIYNYDCKYSRENARKNRRKLGGSIWIISLSKLWVETGH